MIKKTTESVDRYY